MKSVHIFTVAVLILLCVGGVVWFFSTSSSTMFANLPAGLFGAAHSTSTEIAATSGRAIGAGQKEYLNLKYKFSLLYPESLLVKEIDEGGGAMTVTFENTNTLEGFQIFIVPFSGAQITEDRFRRDAPSGVRENLRDITVDGATGASFYSTHPVLGATAEVWFVHGGYLYEVNTFKKLDAWLSTTLSTWMFI